MFVSTAHPLPALPLSLAASFFDSLLHDVIICSQYVQSQCFLVEEERAHISTFIKHDELVTQELHLK